MSAADAFLIAGLYLIAINLICAGAFAWDKYSAAQGGWRVRERTLLTMAAAGGSIGAIAASVRLRHKTYKEPFRTNLRLIALLQAIGVIVVGALVVWRAFQTP